MKVYYNFDNSIEFNVKDRKKPLRIIKGAVIKLENGVKKHLFMIPSGFTSDGCSIPKPLRFLIGCPHTPQYVPASIIHDYLLAHPEEVRYDRYEASLVFFHALLNENVCPLKAVLMFLAVDLWWAVKNLWEDKRV